MSIVHIQSRIDISELFEYYTVKLTYNQNMLLLFFLIKDKHLKYTSEQKTIKTMLNALNEMWSLKRVTKPAVKKKQKTNSSARRLINQKLSLFMKQRESLLVLLE